MQKLSAGKFHCALPAFRATVGFPRSLRLDVGRPDHLGPLFGFVGDQFSELSRRSWQRHAAEVSETGLYLRVVESRVDLLVELVDDLGRRGPRCADAEPTARLVTKYKF